jgi:hypothetical protein
MIYQFRQKTNIYHGIDAQTAGEELERIRNANNGRLETSEVVRWAAEETSPLHNWFTWDNEKAAAEFRLEEARFLIKSIVVITEKTVEPQPAYWNVAITRPATSETEEKVERYYQSAAVISKNPKEYASALTLMLRQMAGAQKGLEQLRSLAPRRDKLAVDRATKHVESAQQVLTDLLPEKH